VEVRVSPAAESLTLDEVAARLGVHYMTVYRYVRLGRLRASQHNGRWLVAAHEVDRIAAGRQPRPAIRQARDHGDQADRLFLRMLAGDGPGSWAVAEQALTVSAPDEVYVDVLAPALRRVGEGWANGELTVADEHRASAVAMRMLGRLSTTFARRGRRRPGTVLIAGASEDPHLMPAAMVADVLRGAGWTVVDLGPDVPRASLLEVAATTPDLVAVGLSVSVDRYLGTVAGTVQALRAAHPDTVLIAGGPAVKDEAVAVRLGVDGWAPDAKAAASLLATMRP
jgi:excisionase family DNA binding protein